MFGIGFPELIVILIVALLVVGPAKLPEVARSVGRALGQFRRMADDVKDSLQQEIDTEEGRRDEVGRKDEVGTPGSAVGQGREAAATDGTHPDGAGLTTAGQEPPAPRSEQEANDPYREQYEVGGAPRQAPEPDKQKGA